MPNDFNSAPQTDVTGFVSTDATNRLTVMSFRGTESFRQAQMDLAMQLIDTGICPGCSASTGFWQSWNESRPVVIAAIHKIQTEFPRNRIVATGHSLGAAIAALAAAELRSHKVKVDLVSCWASGGTGDVSILTKICIVRLRCSESWERKTGRLA